MSNQVDVVISALTMNIEALNKHIAHQAGVIEELNKVIAELRYDEEAKKYGKPKKATK